MILTVCRHHTYLSRLPQIPCCIPAGLRTHLQLHYFNPWCPIFCAGIKYYFINNPMSRFEYMKLLMRWFPQDIINQYNILDLVDKDGFIYVNIHKGTYYLKQATCIDFYHLVQFLKPHGYYPLRSNPFIWCNKTHPTKFVLCVNYFWIKYINPAHDHHLVNTLQKY